MVNLDELNFFSDNKNIDEVLSEFGKVTGSNLLTNLRLEGFVDKKGEFFKLTDMGEKKLKKIVPWKKETSDGLKIFLSYSSLDYDLARQIKFFLDIFGIDVLLAHTSVEPSITWEDEIYKKLRECDIFMPLLTNNFRGSHWTDQESGIAYNEGKRILSLMIDLTPYGFLGKYQALRLDISEFSSDRKDSRIEIINSLNREFPGKMRSCILNSLWNTSSWFIGTIKFRILKEKEPFTKEEVNKIIEVSSENNQLYDAEGARECLSELIRKYRDEINEETLKKIEFRIKGLTEPEIEKLIDSEVSKDQI